MRSTWSEIIDTLLLDAGGVILDEMECERVRAEIAVETLRDRVPGYDLDSYWADVREAVACHVPSVYRYVVWKHSAKNMVIYDALWARHKALWLERDPGLRLMPGIERVLEDLASDFHIVIAGQYGGKLLELMEEHDLTRFLGCTLTQDDFTITKPDPRYYEQILERAGRQASHSIMVGDRIDKDVIPAKWVGLRTIRVRLGIYTSQEPRTPDECPDLEINSIKELPHAVRKLADECFRVT